MCPAPLWSPRPDGGTAARRRRNRQPRGFPSPVGTGEGEGGGQALLEQPATFPKRAQKR